MTSPARFLSLLITFISFISIATGELQPVQAQVITLNKDRIQALARDLQTSKMKLTVSNGFQVTDLGGRMPLDQAMGKIQSRPITHYLYGLIAFRLADQGRLALDSPLYEVFPDYDLGEFFSVPVTIRHLMAQTAGFSVPLFYSRPQAHNRQLQDRDLGDYIRAIRPAGQKTQDDPVATLLLVHALEKISGQTIKQLIQSEIITPMGLSANDITWQANQSFHYPASFAPIFELALSKRLVFRAASLMNRNKIGSVTYLSDQSFNDMKTVVTYAHHPLDHTRTSLQSQFPLAGHLLRSNLLYCHPVLRHQAGFFLINDSRYVFLLSRTDNGDHNAPCLYQTQKKLALKIINHDIPSNLIFSEYRKRQDIFKSMQAPQQAPSGLYMEDNTPSHWSTDRIDRIQHRMMTIHPVAGTENLLVKRHKDTISREFIYQGPYYYESRAGEVLSFARSVRGGYANLDGETYRYTGMIGNRDLLISPYYYLLVINLTVLIYWRSKFHGGWRNMAKIVGISTVIFGLTVWLERSYGSHLFYYHDTDYLIILWRLCLNISMMGLFAMPFFALAFSKRDMMPTGKGAVPAVLHLGLLSLSSISLFVWAMAVNLSGNLTP